MYNFFHVKKGLFLSTNVYIFFDIPDFMRQISVKMVILRTIFRVLIEKFEIIR
jgi:hypothetical protein